MCEDGVIFVWVELQVSAGGQQHPKCQRTIRIVNPPFFWKLRSSSDPINKNLRTKHPDSNSAISATTRTIFSQWPIDYYHFSTAVQHTSPNTAHVHTAYVMHHHTKLFTFLTNFKISDFNKEYTSSLRMIWMRSKHVGAFLSVLIWTF